MSAALAVGLGLGTLLGVGLWLIVLAQPLGWRPTLEQRLEPQLRHHVPASRLLDGETAATSPWGAWGRLLGPPLGAATRLLQNLSPAGETLSRRLEAAGSPLTPVDYRAQQVLWACLGVAAGTAAALVADLSAMSKAETERIWLAFGATAYLALALVRSRAAAALALVLVAGWAVMVNSLLDTGW